MSTIPKRHVNMALNLHPSPVTDNKENANDVSCFAVRFVFGFEKNKWEFFVTQNFRRRDVRFVFVLAILAVGEEICFGVSFT